MTAIPLYCDRCSALRTVEDWRETSPQTLTIALSPCGHEQERTAGVEWHGAGVRRRARVTSIVEWARASQRVRCSPAPRRRTASR